VRALRAGDDHRGRQAGIGGEAARGAGAGALVAGALGRAAAPPAEAVVAIPAREAERAPRDAEVGVGERAEQLAERHQLGALGRDRLVEGAREARGVVEHAQVQPALGEADRDFRALEFDRQGLLVDHVQATGGRGGGDTGDEHRRA
jgi:hypothetical protein